MATDVMGLQAALAAEMDAPGTPGTAGHVVVFGTDGKSAVDGGGVPATMPAVVTATATTDAVTCNGDECLVTTRAFTTAAGATETLVITNSSLVAGKAPHVTVWYGTCTKVCIGHAVSYDTSAHTINLLFESGEESDALDGNMKVLISLRGVAS